MIILLSLLLSLLLCGCAQDTPQPEAPPIPLTNGQPQSLYDPGSFLEEETGGAIQVYPTGNREATGIRAMEKTLLVFSGSERTTLTALQGETLTPVGTKTLDFLLNTRDPSLSLGNRAFSFYDPVSRATLELDETLQELRRIPAPEDLTGSPVLCGNVLYYAAPDGIFAWDLDANIRRCLKKIALPDQCVTGVYLDGAVLQVRANASDQIKTLFLSTESGRLLGEISGEASLKSQGQQFSIFLPWGPGNLAIFGSRESGPQIFLPRQADSFSYFLTHQKKAVTYTSLSGKLLLESYDLDTGLRTAALTLETEALPLSIADTRENIFLLVLDSVYDYPAIYRWDHQTLAVSGSETYSVPYVSGSTDLSQCQAYGQQLSEKFGLCIQISPDSKLCPQAHSLTPETQPGILLRELALLDARLSQLPKTLLSDTAAHFSSLTIALVREIQGPGAPLSLQFMDGSSAYIVITAGAQSESALYRGLFQAMETHILTKSVALDHWEDLNPQGFTYTYGEIPQVSSLYLEGTYQAFISPGSMTFPREDRASIFSAATLSGKETLFQAEAMQAKLQAICQGIREAYGLKKYDSPLPWEQYLERSPAR